MRVAILSAFPAHVIPGFAAQRPAGHYATWLPQLAEAFGAQREIEFHWLFVSKHLRVPEPVVWHGQQFHCLHSPQRGRALRAFAPDCRAIRTRLDALRPDLVHAWGTEDCYGLAAMRSGRPFLLSMQGLLSHYVRISRMHWLVRLQAIYERAVLRKARWLTVESRWGEHILREWAPTARIWRVEYGVQERFFQIAWQPDPARPAAVFIGTPDERKGIRDAVRAFAEPQLAGAELLVVGDAGGPLVEELRRTATPNVRWLGRLTPDETAAVLSRAWCLVLPTRADTSPNVVKEARVVGLPVVTTPCGGQSDYIEDGANGWLVAPGDIPALAERLARTMAGVEIARELGAHRHEEQRAWFRPEQTAEKFMSIYRELAG